MSVPIGTRLGRYEILAVLGAGGMGEVYRAYDASLKRDVAVKILLDRLAADADGIRRFQQEALATAALNHPNILAVYDVGTHEGTAFVVSELLEGRTLLDLLSAGALPLRKTIDYASQIANGLAAAHEKGIVHRDLKPANLWVTKDGRVKILDFGLARILRDPTLDEGASLRSAPTMTRPDTVLGTAGYMAPEQVRGEPADHRADIFSFGVVLYEMLTGRRAFKRETVPGTLAAILDADPPSWPGDGSSLSLRSLRLAHRCLEKSPQARFQSARDLALVFADEGSDTSLVPLVTRYGPVGPVGLLTAAVLLIALGAWGFARFGSPRVAPAVPASVAFEIPPPLGDRWESAIHPAISNDGTRIVYAAVHDGVTQLHMKTLTDPTARLVPGTAGATQPFFSPDGSQIGFFADGQLKSTSISQGPPHVICPASAPRGGAWGVDDFIVFASGPFTGLSRVPVSGGAPEPFTFLDATKGETSHRFPRVLPGTAAVLFTVQNSKREASVAVQAALSRQHTTVIERGEAPAYAKGQLLFLNNDFELAAAPFDPQTLKVTGPVAALPERPTRGVNFGDSSLSVSRNGTLVYLPFEADLHSLVIVDREGRGRPVPGPEQPYFQPAVSPDGKRLAVVIGSSSGNDLWVGAESGGFTRLTTDGGSMFPIWSPDSRTLALGSVRSGYIGVFSQGVDGGGEARQLTACTALTEAVPMSWLPDGKALLINQIVPATSVSEPRILTLGQPGPPKPLFPTKSSVYGKTSPDGRWLAYTSAVSGQWEVYVTPLAGPGRTVPVSRGGGGREIVWAKSSGELFFRRLQGQVVSVRVGVNGPSDEAPRPVSIGDFTMEDSMPWNAQYDTLPDGRFVIVKGQSNRQGTRPLIVVLNWVETLSRR